MAGHSIHAVERVRRVCVEHGLERAFERKDPEREYLRELGGRGEAQLIALSCGAAPEGRARWTLRLLAARLVELEMVESIISLCAPGGFVLRAAFAGFRSFRLCAAGRRRKVPERHVR